MLDFMKVTTKNPKKDTVEIYPKFIVKASKDLMIRGGDFYAIWNEEEGLWSTSEEVALQLIDKEIEQFYKDFRTTAGTVLVSYLWDADSGMIDKWHKYVQKQLRDNYHELDSKLIFSNTETSKEDYVSKRLPYPLEDGDISAYDELMSTLYSEEERKKIEWAIGAIISGDSIKIQKFIVMYGAAGTGKSTVLNIIQDLFEGYYTVFDAKALGSNGSSFALEPFKSNPLVAIQHDGDLSRIEDNTRLNSVVSHELMTVNEKFKSAYTNRFNCFLFMGSNKPVKITDAKSGLLRRLIDVSPSGKKLSQSKYKKVTHQIKFELGAIAKHCLEVYISEPDAYDTYVPVSMLGASNDFYNYILDSYDVFKKQNGTTLKSAWELYKQYCEDAKVPYPYSQRVFKEELKNYFDEFEERSVDEDGVRVRNYYSGFNLDRFEYKPPASSETSQTLSLHCTTSLLDAVLANAPAQLTKEDGTPEKRWDNVRTTLADIDTHKLHYVKVPINHIVIDFDIPDPVTGEKSLERNLEAASKWPATYAELSKSGCAIHLHYIYTGDPTKLSSVYDDHIEIKVFNGNSSLRRMVTKCNDVQIAQISSGLPLKEEGKMVDFKTLTNEKAIRTLIIRNLRKEYHDSTKCSVDFIKKVLDQAYEQGMTYDVTDLLPDVISFASESTHQSATCLDLVSKMKFQSDDVAKAKEEPQYKADFIIFYDIEVFKNVWMVCYKREGEGQTVVRLINPTPKQVEELLQYKLVGFNNRRYDNHILYAAMMGYSNEALYDVSKRIVRGDATALFREAYNLSYTDIYDFSSKKQSLKKFEIELGIHHQENSYPWDEPLAEEHWEEVADYCCNDVLATEAVFNARKGDFLAREILATIAGGIVNDTTNTLTTRLIFGKERHPQSQFCYRNLAEPITSMSVDMHEFLYKEFPDMMNHWKATPHMGICSELPFFPGYIYDRGKSYYKGYEVGEGGFVWANPGMYGMEGPVITFDVASMHPHSITSEYLFGEFTERFNDLMKARIFIKHGDYDAAGELFGGMLKPYLKDKGDAKALAGALKIAINSVYGLTAAKFENAFNDSKNVDNIVAKRGALFMIDLLEAVHEKGGTVVHIKTDSIKLYNPSQELVDFVITFGKWYGYDFEVEHVFEKICLVNDAVYVAKLAKDDPEEPGKWTATGTQFQVPYVFKTMFSKEPITFDDLCETKSVTSSLYLDFDEFLTKTPTYTELKEAREQQAKGANLTKKQLALLEEMKSIDDADLGRLLAKEHDYHFVGKVGSFCPIKPNCNGGLLVREKDGKYSSATGCKGYRWKEAEVVRANGEEDQVDKSYYISLVDKARETINNFGDIEWFVSD